MKGIQKKDYIIKSCMCIIEDEVDNSYVLGEEFDKALTVLKEVDGDWRAQQYFERAEEIKRQYVEGMLDSDYSRNHIMANVEKGIRRLFSALEERSRYFEPEYYANEAEAIADVRDLLAEAI